MLEHVHGLVPPEELYRVTGTQYLPFNTIYQIVAEQQGPLWSRAAHAVLIPDLVAYWLTGELRSELTNASTTALLDLAPSHGQTRCSTGSTFPPICFHRSQIPVRSGVSLQGLPVVTVGSHDTASAVAAVPATTERFAYVSCGTWSFVGLELEAGRFSPKTLRLANFTNELGVGGRIRFLRNVGGLWLLQECLRVWGTECRAALLEKRQLVWGGAGRSSTLMTHLCCTGRHAESDLRSRLGS